MSGSLENADTALGEVAPKGVRINIDEKKNWLKTKWNKFQQTHPKLFFIVNTLNAFFNLALYFADIYTDIVLLIDFIKYDWIYCSIGSICFLALPYLVAMVGIVVVLKNQFWNGIDSDSKLEIKVCMSCCFCFTLPFFIVLPFLFDLLMPFYRLMDKCLPDTLMNFMAQYEATRTLSETVLESLPQFGLQIYMVLWCRANTCNFVEEGDGALIQAFTVSIISITYRLVLTWFEIHAENMTVKEYLTQLVKMGGGLPLAAIAHNQIEEVDIGFELDLAQVRLLAGVLRTNTSVKKLDLCKCNMSCEGWKLIGESLKDNSTLKLIEAGETLRLDNNEIADEGCRHLAPALAEMKGLERLDLNYNKIADDGCRHLAPALAEMKGLKELYLSKNNIGAEGCRHLAPALAEMKGLKALILRNNEIADEGKKAMREAWEKAGKDSGELYL